MAPAKPGDRLYPVFFGLVCLVFLGILAFAYRATRRASPVMLDEHGRIVASR